MFNRFLAILSFMTTIPIKSEITLDKDFQKSIIFFPVIGLILGIIYAAVLYIFNFFFGSFVAAVICTASMIVLTGGLHLDGLGDTFDGLYSYREKDRILEIMKDSRLGTNAMLAIFIFLLSKISALQVLTEKGFYFSVMIMPVISRSIVVYSCYKGRTIRKDGMGNAFIGKISTKDFSISIILSVIIISLISIVSMGSFGVLINIPILILMIVMSEIYKKHVYKRIDGLTGDVLGAIGEMSEVVYLFLFYMGVYLCRLYI